MSIYPSRLAAVGIVKESLFGGGGAPALLLPQSGPSLNDDLGLAPDASWRVAPAATFGMVVATAASKLQLGGAVYPDGVGFPLAGLLGDVAFAGGSPNVWTMALLNTGAQQPPSYALVLNDPTGQVQFAGARFSDLTLAYEAAQPINYQASAAGLAGAPTALSMPAPSSELLIGSWRSVTTIGGSIEGQTLTAQVKLARTVEAKRNVTGALAPYLQRSDVLRVTGTVSLAASTDTYRQNALAGSLTSLDIAFSYGAGAATRALQLHCSSVALTSVNRSYGARWVELDLEFEAIANATDVGASGGLSPIKATLKNAVSSGVYA